MRPVGGRQKGHVGVYRQLESKTDQDVWEEDKEKKKIGGEKQVASGIMENAQLVTFLCNLMQYKSFHFCSGT